MRGGGGGGGGEESVVPTICGYKYFLGNFTRSDALFNVSRNTNVIRVYVYVYYC